MFGNGLSAMAVFLPFFFVVNNVGENVTTAFDSMNEAMYVVTWYGIPIELQKYLIPMLLSTEAPMRVPVFANSCCSRGTFKEVTLSDEC